MLDSFKRIRKFHFTGIGGSGMSGLAFVLKNSGFEVSGSDLARSETTARLEKVGIKIYYNHRPENIGDCQVLVYSSACLPDNPEIVHAKKTRRIVLKRAEMLQELAHMKYAIAVAGSHGKTTVTSLAASLLEKAGLDPTVVIGGRIKGWESGGKLGRSKYLVCEADESDRSFLSLKPTIACVTNIDHEHLDHYSYSFAKLKRAFLSFLSRVPLIEGVCVVCGEDRPVREVAEKVKRSVVTYGLAEGSIQARDVELLPFACHFSLVKEGVEMGRVRLSLPGIHNVLNSLAACAVAFLLGVPFEVVREGLESFSGVERRLELRGERRGIKLYDDYGHHPTEIKKTLAALRNAYPERRIVAIFQPHRYTRTSYLYQEFGKAFDEADILILTEIYAAGEEPVANVTANLIYETARLAKGEGVIFIPDKDKITPLLLPLLKEGDVLITLGAGNIWQVGLEILERL